MIVIVIWTSELMIGLTFVVTVGCVTSDLFVRFKVVSNFSVILT